MGMEAGIEKEALLDNIRKLRKSLHDLGDSL